MRSAASLFSTGLVSLTIFGCGAATRDFATWDRNYSEIDMTVVSLGDTKEQIREKLGKPAAVIGSKAFTEGTVEVWSYEKWLSQFGRDYKEQEVWVYFTDGKLTQWGRPGDWEREADRIYEVRMR